MVERGRSRSRVVEDPSIMSGAPCVSGTRVPASTIVAYLRAGYSDSDIFEDYPTLPPDGIDAVREWAADRWLQESVAAVERGRAQIAAGQSHDMDDVIAKLEAIVSPTHDRS